MYHMGSSRGQLPLPDNVKLIEVANDVAPAAGAGLEAGAANVLDV